MGARVTFDRTLELGRRRWTPQTTYYMVMLVGTRDQEHASTLLSLVVAGQPGQAARQTQVGALVAWQP